MDTVSLAALSVGTFSVLFIWYQQRKEGQKEKRFISEGWLSKPIDPFYKGGNYDFCKCVLYKGWVLPGTLKYFKDEFFNFKARPDDVIVVTFPKSGTTWMQEITYLITHDVNILKAKLIGLHERSPFFEFHRTEFEIATNLESPRVIKSHLPYQLLPQDVIKKSKIITVIRNPKDVIVSFYYFYCNLIGVTYNGTFQQFWEKFLKDDVLYCPYWKTVLEFWQHRNDNNVLLVRYEDMIRDIKPIIKKIAKFLGKPLSDSQVQLIAEYTSFSKMKSNKSSNYDECMDLAKGSFMRKGEIGDWKNHFTISINEITDKWIKENLQGSDLKFDYE